MKFYANANETNATIYTEDEVFEMLVNNLEEDCENDCVNCFFNIPEEECPKRMGKKKFLESLYFYKAYDGIFEVELSPKVAAMIKKV